MGREQSLYLQNYIMENNNDNEKNKVTSKKKSLKGSMDGKK